MLSKCFFLSLSLVFFCSNGIKGGNVSHLLAAAAKEYWSRPHLEDFSGGDLSRALDDASNSDGKEPLSDSSTGHRRVSFASPTGGSRGRPRGRLSATSSNDLSSLLDLTGDSLEENLRDAMNDDDRFYTNARTSRLLNTQPERGDPSMDVYGRSTQERLSEAIGDEEERSGPPLTAEQLQDMSDASRDERNSFAHLTNSDDSPEFDFGRLSMSSFFDENGAATGIALDKMPEGQIPPTVIVRDYSPADQEMITRLFRSALHGDLRELFQFIARRIHRRYVNCGQNLGNWLLGNKIGGPIFNRNCVPCANAVDLNLRNLAEHLSGGDSLHHYFVNTCHQSKLWVSYISNLIPAAVDLRDNPSATFSNVVQENLLANHR